MASKSDWMTKTEELGDRLAPKLAAAVEAWYDGKDHSLTSWRKMLQDTLGPRLFRYLQTEHSRELRTRGFELPKERKEYVRAVKESIDNTNDIRETLLSAEDDTTPAITAALKLRSLLSAAHQRVVATSLVRAARDRFEQAAFAAQRLATGQGTGFSGRKRFEAGDPSPGSRHAPAHLQVVGPGERFSLPERRIGNKVLAAKEFDFPRQDPTDTAEWSGSVSRVTYEYVTRTGRREWR